MIGVYVQFCRTYRHPGRYFGGWLRTVRGRLDKGRTMRGVWLLDRNAC